MDIDDLKFGVAHFKELFSYLDSQKYPPTLRKVLLKKA